MADSEGFEPSVRLHAHSLSRRAHSTALATVLKVDKSVFSKSFVKARGLRFHTSPLGGGQSWIRTSVHIREQIYNLPPLTTRPSTLFWIPADAGRKVLGEK